jgi:hypothetical protein
LHIDQPDFFQQEPFMKRLQGGTFVGADAPATKRTDGLQARQLFTSEPLDQRVQQRVNARANAPTPPPIIKPSQASMKCPTEL